MTYLNQLHDIHSVFLSLDLISERRKIIYLYISDHVRGCESIAAFLYDRSAMSYVEHRRDLKFLSRSDVHYNRLII